MAAVVAQEQTVLSCVMIPVAGTQLLLPNVCIAEIVPWRRMQPMERSPAWCLGLLGWRGENIPVIRYEILNKKGSEGAPKTGRCMVVMNRARSAEGPAFYALAADQLPRMVQLNENDISNTPISLGPAETVVVAVGTEPAVIPNLEYIEEQVRALGELGNP